MKTNKSNSKPTVEQSRASFRDPAGFVFSDPAGNILRHVAAVGAADFELFNTSGLYKQLVQKKLIVSHVAQNHEKYGIANTHAVIRPQQIPFISYPFEWSFSQLKDAALLTLAIQKQAIARGMTLKDASAYNVQFLQGKPIFIDTLSFEAYIPGTPWQAYRQFCEHFLAPLALMAYTDIRLSQLMRVYLDGVPLDLAAKLLPKRARIKPSLIIHIMLHAKAQKAKAKDHKQQTSRLSQSGLLAIIDSLERAVKRLEPRKVITEWGDYYDNTNYTLVATKGKMQLVSTLVKPLNLKTVLDLGGNDGHYSRVLNKLGAMTVCSDIDPNAVEANYRQVRSNKEQLMLPLVIDLTNPGGALGWHNSERQPIHERLQCDLVLSLALIHHLAISNNLPFGAIARYLREFGPYLLIEFVPKDDSQVQKLLSTRKDIFPDYNETGLLKAFGEYYKLINQAKIKGSKRTLYLFKRK